MTRELKIQLSDKEQRKQCRIFNYTTDSDVQIRIIGNQNIYFSPLTQNNYNQFLFQIYAFFFFILTK